MIITRTRTKNSKVERSIASLFWRRFYGQTCVVQEADLFLAGYKHDGNCQARSFKLCRMYLDHFPSKGKFSFDVPPIYQWVILLESCEFSVELSFSISQEHAC
jgi:hypothetical protein